MKITPWILNSLSQKDKTKQIKNALKSLFPTVQLQTAISVM